MAKLRGAALGALGGILATAFFAGTAVVGCGDDTGGTATPEDSGADHTSGSSSGSSSSSSGAGSSSSSSGGASSSSSGAGSSSSSSSSSSSGGGSDAGEGGAATDADAGVTTSDAEAGVPACTTMISQLATGGSDGGTEAGAEAGSDSAADAGLDTGLDAPVDTGADVELDASTEAAAPLSPTLLFGFDNGSDTGWVGSVNGSTTEMASLGASLTDGHSCAGALSFAVTYATYNVQASETYNYSSPQNWVGRSKLHFWLKVTTTNYAGLDSAQVFVQSNSYGGYRSTNIGLTDAAWHEVILDLTPPLADAAMDYDPAVVNALGVQLNAAGSGPDGGPAAPAPATLLVDDIWLE